MENHKTNPPASETGMLIRKPVEEVFAAFCDPETMSKFWFTSSSGQIEEGKTLTWEWEMYGAKGDVQINKIDENKLIAFTWDVAGTNARVEITFTEKTGNTTFVAVRETGYDVTNPHLVSIVAGQTGGWAYVLSALKAYLEHNILLRVVHDHAPDSWVQKQP